MRNEKPLVSPSVTAAGQRRIRQPQAKTTMPSRCGDMAAAGTDARENDYMTGYTIIGDLATDAHAGDVINFEGGDENNGGYGWDTEGLAKGTTIMMQADDGGTCHSSCDRNGRDNHMSETLRPRTSGYETLQRGWRDHEPLSGRAQVKGCDHPDCESRRAGGTNAAHNAHTARQCTAPPCLGRSHRVGFGRRTSTELAAKARVGGARLGGVSRCSEACTQVSGIEEVVHRRRLSFVAMQLPQLAEAASGRRLAMPDTVVIRCRPPGDHRRVPAAQPLATCTMDTARCRMQDRASLPWRRTASSQTHSPPEADSARRLGTWEPEPFGRCQEGI